MNPGANSIRVYLRGGLGNQLFQYAAGRALSRISSKRLILDKSLLPHQPDSVGVASRWPYALESLPHNAEVEGKGQPPNRASNFARYLQIQRLLGDKQPGILLRRGVWAGEQNEHVPNEEDLLGVRVINTYATSIGFPLAIEDELKQLFAKIAPESIFVRQRVEDSQVNKITAVHLRLGDYVSLHETYGASTAAYFDSALKRTPGDEVWLFTENRDAVPEDLRKAINPSRVLDAKDIHSPLQNLALMSQCSSIICANSTFSWWAAFLAGKRANIVVPIMRSKVNIHKPEMRREGWIPIAIDF